MRHRRHNGVQAAPPLVRALAAPARVRIALEGKLDTWRAFKDTTVFSEPKDLDWLHTLSPFGFPFSEGREGCVDGRVWTCVKRLHATPEYSF